MQDWFYHAPAKRREDCGAVEYPAPSQIPLLSGVELDGTEDEYSAKRGYYKESDTKYIRLAKQGGRKDLLRFRSPKTLSEEPVPYPRPEWLDWNETREPDAGPRQVYMPEYMVYDEHQADADAEPYYARQPPYSLHDNISVFQRDGAKATDKTVRLPEIKRPHKRHTFQKVQSNKPAGLDRTGKKQQPANRPGVNDTEPVAFNKLLSMGYQKDWVLEREKYYKKQQSVIDQKRKLVPANAATVSEYQEAIGKGVDKPVSGQTSTQRRTKFSASEKKEIPVEDDKLFKLSKFNKVQAKVNTRREDQTYPHNMQSSQPQPMEA
ncbi:uncharacterized protein C7orf57 homolog isoform X2 [Saccoglossus kowalevskii]|uniref:Uncharacterized protein C7orf57-like n=1 Tax=Saccoglossus kowalevskii TaxID=10224 RepID=A0ABM0GSR6_SACKO|nr:PREDICTED: uncharacterized protein C7orf57-like [Saccoglossus kowalevskii]